MRREHGATPSWYSARWIVRGSTWAALLLLLSFVVRASAANHGVSELRAANSKSEESKDAAMCMQTLSGANEAESIQRLAENAGTVGYASLHAAMQAVIHGQRITLASLILGKSRSAATEAIEPVAASVETMHEAIVDQTNAVCNGYGVCLPLVFPTPRSGMWPMGASTYMVIAGRDPKAGVNASNADAARLCAARWRLLSFLKWSIQSRDARNIKQSEYFASARPPLRLDILQQLSALKCGGQLRQQSGELPANGEVTVLEYAHFPGADQHASEALLVALENFYALNVDNMLSFEKVAIEDSRAPAQAVLGSLRAGALAFAISDSITPQRLLSDATLKADADAMELLFIPIGTTPVVPVVVLPTAELRLPQNVAFTPIQLDAIFAPDGSSGSIACWSNFSLSTNVAADIVGALPAQPVRRVIQAAGGHVTSALTSFLAAATGVPCASHPLACSDEPAWAQPSSLLAEMESVCPCANSSLPGNATREGGDVAVGVVAAVAVGFPLLIFTSCAMRWSLQRSRAEKLWRISLAEVDFPAPPVILGRGSFGLVLKVHFRGAEAAVKRFVSPTPTEAGRRRSAGVLRVTGAPRGGAAPIGPWERAPRAGAGPEPEGRESFRAGQGDRQGRGGEVLWSNVSLHREPSLHTSTSSSVHSAIPDSPMPDNVFPAAQSQRRSSPHDLWASPLDPSQRQSLVAEVKVMVAMRHPNLCPILGVCLDPGKEFLLMEFVEGGSMADMLSCRLALTLDIRMQLAAGIAEGMQYLHLARPPLIHKDLKASNVLVDARLQPKVCDFGMTSHVSKDGEIVGTLLWNAPELLRGAGATRATDVYAYGVTLSEIFNSSGPGRHVYGKANVFQIVQGVKEGTLRPNIDVEVRKEVAELMRACWAQHVGDRPSFSNIVTLLQSLRADHLFLRPLTPQKQPEPGCDGASLPSDVLTRLQAGLKVPPVRHARAAVLFAEIDAPDAEPAALAATERTLHAAVSRILSSRGAMYPSFVRAETRGACVLLCAGLTPSSATGASPPTPDPCVAMARFAQELLSVSLEQPGCDSGVDGSAAQVLDPQDTSLHPDSVDMSRELPQPGESSATAGAAPPPRVRVGCHVGSVLAAVVGGQPGLASLSASGPPFFCIFGTTVCGAVRLAASSRPGAAQLSQRFASALVGATDVEESLRTHPPWHPGEQEPGAHPTSVWLLAGQRDGDGQDQRSVRATAAGAHRAPGTGTLHDQCGDPAVQGGWAGADQQPGASRAELLCAAASGMASGMARELQLQGHLPPHPARSASTACRLDAHGAVLDLIAEATAGAASGDEIQGALTKLVAKFNFKIYEIDQSEYYGQEAKATEEGVLSDLGESRTMVIGTGNSSGGLSKSRAGASAPGTWGLSDLLLVSPKSS